MSDHPVADSAAERRARFAEVDARRRARDARDEVLLAAFAADPRARVFPDRSMDRPVAILVHPDMETPGAWRISRWDALGPVGHVCRATYVLALRRAHEDDADFAAALDVDAGTIDAALLALGVVMVLDVAQIGRVLTRDDRDPSIGADVYLDRLLGALP